MKKILGDFFFGLFSFPKKSDTSQKDLPIIFFSKFCFIVEKNFEKK